MSFAELATWARDQIAANQLASGGLVVVAASAIGYHLRALPSRFLAFVAYVLLIEVEVRQPDRLYDWIGEWLADTEYARRARLLSAVTSFNHTSNLDKRRIPILLIPGIGRHLFRVGGHWIFVHRDRDGEVKGGEAGLDSLFQRENYAFRALRISRGAIFEFLEAARDSVLEREGTGPDVYIGMSYGDWLHLRRAEPRPLGTVVLPHDVAESTLRRCRDFLASRDRYRSRGTPWRMGMLLNGPPGCGKTSLVLALATELDMDVAILNLGNDELTDTNLFKLLGCAGRRIVVLEDVDSIFEQRDRKDAGDALTFSGLLNALDGIASGEGHIVIMTTNHPERLDEALIRPGRIDLEVKIPMPDRDQLSRLYLRFFQDAQPEAATRFASSFAGVSMAAAQERLLTLEAKT